jgi:hypothetical protein
MTGWKIINGQVPWYEFTFKTLTFCILALSW